MNEVEHLPQPANEPRHHTQHADEPQLATLRTRRRTLNAKRCANFAFMKLNPTSGDSSNWQRFKSPRDTSNNAPLALAINRLRSRFHWRRRPPAIQPDQIAWPVGQLSSSHFRRMTAGSSDCGHATRSGGRPRTVPCRRACRANRPKQRRTPSPPTVPCRHEDHLTTTYPPATHTRCIEHAATTSNGSDAVDGAPA